MLTVKSAFFDGELSVVPYKDKSGKVIKGVYAHEEEHSLFGRLLLNGKEYDYSFDVIPGYIGNFASSPDIWLVQKIVPSYVKGDNVYNSGFDAHDWLYSREGVCNSGEVLTRSEVDDFARGVMRESATIKRGWGARIRCSIMDVSVGLFAGNKRHWGNDTFKSKPYAHFWLKEVK